MVVGVAKVREDLHRQFHRDAGLSVMDPMVSLDHHLEVYRQTIHILHLLLDHEHHPIVQVEYDMDVAGCIPLSVDLDPTGLEPIDDCRPDEVCLCGVSNS